MRSTSIRFTGMASGMDTDSIVKDMLRPQQYRIDTQKKAQALVQLKQDAWKDMNKKLFDFHTKFTDKMRLASTFNKNNTTSSNTDAMSIDSGATVPQGTHKFDITSLAESISIAQRIENPSDEVATAVTLKFKLQGEGRPEDGKEIEITVEAGETLENAAILVAEKLKENGFSANYKDGVFFANSTNTGSQEKIVIDSGANGDAKDLFKKLGLMLGDDPSNPDHQVKGEDAVYTYNGTIFKSATNEIEINGIKATLKAANTGSVTISSTPDTEATYAWIKEFVTEYNNLIDEINDKIGTKPAKGIEPLTAEERESMSESEIKLWEEKLNSSLFYRDEQLTDFVNSARNILGQVFPPRYDEAGKKIVEYRSLADLGIVTGSWEERGKLHIIGDEDDALYSNQPNKLKEALEKDPGAVGGLFAKFGDALYQDHNKKLTASNDLKSAMNFYNDKVIAKKVQTFDSEISTLEDRMYKMEAMYVARFAAMEKMLSSLNSQSSWLSQQFGG